jgi:hypothetical protein
MQYKKVNVNVEDKIKEFMIDTYEKLISIKYDVLSDVKPEIYIQNYQTILQIEEDYNKLVDKYVDMKWPYQLSIQSENK